MTELPGERQRDGQSASVRDGQIGGATRFWALVSIVSLGAVPFTLLLTPELPTFVIVGFVLWILYTTAMVWACVRQDPGLSEREREYFARRVAWFGPAGALELWLDALGIWRSRPRN